MKAPTGYVLYEGPSRIDGSPIVVVATGFGRSSKNPKTGKMVQIWILAADVDPISAMRTGADVGICGGCEFRPTSYDGDKYYERRCYVNPLGPLGVYKAYKAGSYATEWSMETFRDYIVRLGAYGDPAAAPIDVWAEVTHLAAGWTGYTHQARNPKLRDVLQWCQLSADQLGDAEAARDAGCGSFRVLGANDEPAPFETMCPAPIDGTTCADCQACNGFDGANIAIRVHGAAGLKYDTPTKRRPIQLPVLNVR